MGRRGGPGAVGAQVSRGCGAARWGGRRPATQKCWTLESRPCPALPCPALGAGRGGVEGGATGAWRRQRRHREQGRAGRSRGLLGSARRRVACQGAQPSLHGRQLQLRADGAGGEGGPHPGGGASSILVRRRKPAKRPRPAPAQRQEGGFLFSPEKTLSHPPGLMSRCRMRWLWHCASVCSTERMYDAACGRRKGPAGRGGESLRRTLRLSICLSRAETGHSFE